LRRSRSGSFVTDLLFIDSVALSVCAERVWLDADAQALRVRYPPRDVE